MFRKRLLPLLLCLALLVPLTACQGGGYKEIKPPVEKLSWGMIPYVQALLLARCLRGDLDGYPPFLWK